MHGCRFLLSAVGNIRLNNERTAWPPLMLLLLQ
jgi:hypothetical protein